MRDQPEWVFETLDHSGAPVVLSRATWHAKAGNDDAGTHPEIYDYLEDVRAAIESPPLVLQSTRDERSCIFYRLGVGRGEFAGKPIVVVAKYMQEVTSRRGYVTTMYLSRAVYSRGTQLWPEWGTFPDDHRPL
ncbi:MAG TPA: hypothetical protein VNP04_29380 [Alphaproteobacteria bacterium]|nr:hypothetical protein [Alphaproteobacteria bacterium]